MRNIVLTIVSAAGVAAVVCALLTWSVRREIGALENRRSELEAQRASYKSLEELTTRYETARRAVELKRSLVQRARERQTPAAALLAAMAAIGDVRVERVSLTPEGGEISGRADTPVAANEVGEQLAARGALVGFELKRFERGAFTLTVTLTAGGAAR